MIDRSLLSRIVSLFESSKSSKGGQRRDCDFRVATATDSPYARFKVVGGVLLNYRMCKWRKCPYLPFQPLVRPPPAAPYGLACSRFQPSFYEDEPRKKPSSTVERKKKRPLRRGYYLHRHTPPEQLYSGVYLFFSWAPYRDF